MFEILEKLLYEGLCTTFTDMNLCLHIYKMGVSELELFTGDANHSPGFNIASKTLQSNGNKPHN